jgi:dolichol-phosphate mannosyltransferase
LLKSDVGIIIPALNEPYLETLVHKLEGYTIHVETERGLSFAVRHGILMSDEKVLVVMDADGSHPPEAIPEMVNMLDSRTWFIIGSRYLNGGYSYDSIPRKIVSLCYCLIARVFLRTSIKDVMSGFWVGYKEKFTFKPDGNYKFGLQLIRKYKKHIKEVPIIFKKRQAGKSKVKAIQALKDLLSIIKR